MPDKTDMVGIDDAVADVVAHYGVKGMRWGVRRKGTRGSTPPSKRKPKDKPSSGKSGGGASSKLSKARAAVESLTKKKEAPEPEPTSSKEKFKKDRDNLASLSDHEINERIKRIKMEDELSTLLKDPPKPKSKTKKAVEEVVSGTAVKVGKATLEGASIYAIDKAFPQIEVKKYYPAGGKGKSKEKGGGSTPGQNQSQSQGSSIADAVSKAYVKYMDSVNEARRAAEEQRSKKAYEKQPKPAPSGPPPSKQTKPKGKTKTTGSQAAPYSVKRNPADYDKIVMPDGTELFVPRK